MLLTEDLGPRSQAEENILQQMQEAPSAQGVSVQERSRLQGGSGKEKI